MQESTFSADSLTVCNHMQSHASTSVLTLKIPNTGSHTVIWTHDNTAHSNRNMYVTECIVCAQGHDPLTFSFPVVLSLFFLLSHPAPLHVELHLQLMCLTWAIRISRNSLLCSQSYSLLSSRLTAFLSHVIFLAFYIAF